jgi:uncharacterized protein involved in exopolysaccharide biosynthesis
MMHAGQQSDGDEALNLFEIGAILWANKWLLMAATAASVGLSLAYVFTARDWYRAEVLLKLADTKQTQGLLGQLGGGLGGLASLAGIDLGDNKSAEPIAVLKSREFAAAFIEDKNLLPVFFAKKWDASAKRWKSSAPDKRPDIRDGIRYFEKTIYSVQEDKKTGLITVSVEWTDAATAATWANVLVQRANDRMRQRAIAEAESSMTYLTQELAASTVVTLEQSIGRVIEIELQKLTLAKVNDEYAFRVIDHAQVPKWHDSPNRPLIVAAAFIIGLGISSIFVVSRYIVRRDPTLRRNTQLDSIQTKRP